MRSFLLALFFLTPLAHAFDIPKGLDADDRLEIVRTLGLNTATKMLNNPYPLGGYSGFELGYSIEYVNIRDIRRLGCTPGSAGCGNSRYADETEWRYSRLTIGKGLYNDLDVFFNFIPPVGGVHVSDYGGALRWSFYQARFLPINLAAIVHFDQLNYGDSFINHNFGGELMVGVNVDSFALYFGGGEIQATGTFIGGSCGAHCTVDASDPSLDAQSRTVTAKVTTTHTVVGVSLHFENLFAAAEVDRYQDAVYSLKAGVRF
jgi:hypothetical protein